MREAGATPEGLREGWGAPEAWECRRHHQQEGSRQQAESATTTRRGQGDAQGPTERERDGARSLAMGSSVSKPLAAPEAKRIKGTHES